MPEYYFVCVGSLERGWETSKRDHSSALCSQSSLSPRRFSIKTVVFLVGGLENESRVRGELRPNYLK